MIVLKWIRSFFPTALPRGRAEFEKWLGDIVELSGLPDNHTTRRASALFIFSTSPHVARVSKRHIVKQLQKAASNQVASAMLKEADEAKKESDLRRTASVLVSEAQSQS